MNCDALYSTVSSRSESLITAQQQRQLEAERAEMQRQLEAERAEMQRQFHQQLQAHGLNAGDVPM